MAANILSVGESALAAAQVGLLTTGHNIANANTPGYTRQVVIQGSAGSQNGGFGFVGKGTNVQTVQRVYSQFLNDQVNSAQTSQNELDAYYGKIQQINNMFADSTSGLSPTLQNFFSSLQGAAADPASGAARQTLLSSAQTMAAQFQGMSSQLSEIRDGVNTEIRGSIDTINGYATQIAQLNDLIEKAQGGDDSQPANDLLDQRDQAISDLSKQIKVTVVKQNDTYNVFIGNGQPLVVADSAYKLVPTTSPTDLSRIEVGYQGSNGITVSLSESGLTGGKLGGLFDFRANSLDPAQNALGRIAIALGTTFNAQHELGQDLSGNLGGAFFNVGSPQVSASTANTGDAVLSAKVSNVNALTTSDYQIQYDGSNYTVTRLSDNTVTTSASLPMTVDGVDIDIASGTIQAGDLYSLRPTADGASGFSVAITDPKKVALAAPIRTAATLTNKGSATISAGSIDSTYTSATVTPAVTLTYTALTGEFTGFPASLPVTVTDSAGNSTVYPAGSPVAYSSGDTISFGGVNLSISGTPADGDTFTVGPNTAGTGDNRNAQLLAALQSATTMDGGTNTYQAAYGQLVNLVGNKTNELKVTSTAQSKLLDSAVAAQQSESGVNLDEEASNLIRYQQAYAAAAKVMQTADKLFDVLLSLGAT
jgi:flagellar hook-associated protein 1 FlgK